MNDPQPPATGWQPRFSLFTMLLVMTIACVLAAGASYFYQMVEREGGNLQPIFVVFMIAAPTLLAFIVAILWQVYAAWHGGNSDDDEPQ